MPGGPGAEHLHAGDGCLDGAALAAYDQQVLVANRSLSQLGISCNHVLAAPK